MQLTVSTFRTDCTDKEQAKKVLEEAAEAYGAWEGLAATREVEASLGAYAMMVPSFADDLADEIADTITACANLAERYGLDLQAALGRVERKNRERGRYENGCG